MTNKLEDYHITNLQQFDFDPTKVDPREEANTDQGAINIDHILDHKWGNNFPNRTLSWQHYNLGTLQICQKMWNTLWLCKVY